MTNPNERSERNCATKPLDPAHDLPAATPEELEALRSAAAAPLGQERTTRWLLAVGKSVTREELRKRPITEGDPFSL